MSITEPTFLTTEDEGDDVVTGVVVFIVEPVVVEFSARLVSFNAKN